MDDVSSFEPYFCQMRELAGNIHEMCKEMNACMQTFRQTVCDRKRTYPRR